MDAVLAGSDSASETTRVKGLSTEMQDVFRFPLSQAKNLGAYNLRELLRQHLKDLLDLLIPTSDREDLKIDGFKLLSDRNTIHTLYPSEEDKKTATPDGPLDLYEPRINYIRRLLEALLQFVDLEANGKRVQVDGFRLKNLNQWLSPSGGAADILAHAAGRCNLRCRFCYNQGAPETLRPDPRIPADEFKEIRIRIQHYVPAGKLNLFPNMGSPKEILAHPNIADILGKLRQKTEEPFRFSTNGSTLTGPMIEVLEEAKPIYLDVSLNSSSPERRRWLMRDPHPETALNSLAALRQAGIPYSVVIVPWPFPSHEAMMEDLGHTVDFAAGHDPTLIQISMPGYSRRVSEKPLFDHEKTWADLKTRVQELRLSTDCPLVIRPGLYEEYADPNRQSDPILSGVIRNSPLARAGVRAGDRIVKVNGLPVFSRTQARSLMAVIHQSNLCAASLLIERKGEMIKTDLHPLDFDYPYGPETAALLGGVFSCMGIPKEWVDEMTRLIRSHQAEEVLVLTSRLVRPSLENHVMRSGLPHKVRLHIQVPKNGYFGGNIHMGDLMVVQDFMDAVRAFRKSTDIEPDLVIIPSSPFHLSGWARDLTGRVYLEIERHTGIPVALLECDPIFD